MGRRSSAKMSATEDRRYPKVSTLIFYKNKGIFLNAPLLFFLNAVFSNCLHPQMLILTEIDIKIL